MKKWKDRCYLLQIIETAGKSFIRIRRSYDKNDKLTPYDIFMLNETVKLVNLIPEALEEMLKLIPKVTEITIKEARNN